MNSGGMGLIGAFFSMLAGIFISIQGAFNTRVSEKIGLWETTAIVHGVGLIFALLILLFKGTTGLKRIDEVNFVYLLGGVIGVFIVFSVIKGISSLGAAYSIAILLIVQLTVGTIIDTFGLFGLHQVALSYNKIIGIVTMMIGISIFSFKL